MSSYISMMPKQNHDISGKLTNSIISIFNCQCSIPEQFWHKQTSVLYVYLLNQATGNFSYRIITFDYLIFITAQSEFSL